MRSQAVKLLGISDRTFSRLESEHVIKAVTSRVGRRASIFDGFVLVPSYLAHREQKLTGQLESPRDRRDLSQAELNEMRLARERKQLLPREQVVAEGQAYIAAVSAKLRSLAPRLAQAGHLTPAGQGAVATLLEEGIEELARWQSALALLQAEDE